MSVSEQRKEWLRVWCKRNPEKRFGRYFRARLKNKYGISSATYDCIVLAQHGRCLICKHFLDVPSATNRIRHGKSAVIDHNHETNTVRGILCNNCNRALGLFGHNIEVIKTAARYLQADQEHEKRSNESTPSSNHASGS